MKATMGESSPLCVAGLDVLTVSRRLGHGSPVVTLNTYAHLFEKTDSLAATATEAVLQTKIEHGYGVIWNLGANWVPISISELLDVCVSTY